MTTAPLEIERRFLVARLPDLEGAVPAAIRQGYLSWPGDRVELRLRRSGDACFLTLKSGSGLAREEREAAIDQAAFETFWPATEGRRIEKTRWTGWLAEGRVFELDLFEGAHAPLRIVEVEFESVAAAEAFAPPDWFGAEVTGNPAYSNRVMSVEGVPSDAGPTRT
ncbi:CYTH domain-containing protein [Palleronia aestuarii]|uniref:CYTH domain-containing protein n=1 Tax=Palleronia aestuarii TaxID=568105 RepID=A0A2W7NV82_9RHOB|nr:CYTH domain-containing protein [Palleronia aestuarii]PZX17196.1 CYTH domain-containing protein [Palleronia aestuarii]